GPSTTTTSTASSLPAPRRQTEEAGVAGGPLSSSFHGRILQPIQGNRTVLAAAAFGLMALIILRRPRASRIVEQSSQEEPQVIVESLHVFTASEVGYCPSEFGPDSTIPSYPLAYSINRVPDELGNPLPTQPLARLRSLSERFLARLARPRSVPRLKIRSSGVLGKPEEASNDANPEILGLETVVRRSLPKPGPRQLGVARRQAG
ncbi:hypothetical protein ACYOEI_22985, partial [Singulisphaera rosea]